MCMFSLQQKVMHRLTVSFVTAYNTILVLILQNDKAHKSYDQ